MTLFQRIFILVSVLFLLLLGSLEASYVGESRRYLQEQLASHAQDVATSLGMVLPLSMKDGDTVRMQTTVDAVFERGYYRSIRIVSTRGDTVFLRQLPATPPDVPAWFARLVPLQAPSAESLLSAGWRQLGRVVVTSHPNFAYQQLWHTTLTATGLLLVFYALSLALLWAFLRSILSPLRAIEAVAQDIGERRFTTVRKLPGARELRRVVEAINTLSGKISRAIETEIAVAERWRVEAYRDPLTGFDNRRSFTHQLEHSLQVHGGQSATLYLVQIDGLDALNAAQGFHRGDALIRHLAAALESFDAGVGAQRARLGGSTFALLSWGLDVDAANRLGQGLDQTLSAALERSGEAGMAYGVGAVHVPGNADGVSALLGEADAGARQALAQVGQRHMVMVQHNPQAPDVGGAASWKAFIGDALAAGRIALWLQPVLGFGPESAPPLVLQQEITGSLLDAAGEPVPAARFIPMALRFGQMPLLDGAFLDAIFRRIEASELQTGQLAVNLSMQSVHDEALLQRLLGHLQAHPHAAARIVFELSEFGLVNDLERAAEVVARLRGAGSNFAVDNFGFHASAFQYLQRLRPAYIKLASSYLQDLEQHPENQFFIASVARIARPLDILTLACGVESPERLALLRTLGVDGYQGWASARPQRLA